MAEDVAHGEDVAVGGKGQRDGFASLGDADERAAFEKGAALVDMSGLLLLLCEGGPTAAFGQAVLAGPKLDVGSCAFEAVLLGDGFLASVPLAARTGDDELLVIDPTPRSGLLLSWLEFVSDIERDGVRPYGGLRLKDESDSLVPFVLAGHEATATLSDYVPEGQRLPEAGQVVNLDLDGHITTVTMRPDLPGGTLYVLLVPPSYSRVIWGSLLSFPLVCPVGPKTLASWVQDGVGVLSLLDKTDKVRVEAERLRTAGFLRAGSDFIGARGLRE